ncbi:uncharacterized protein FYW61_008794 isoform 2-T2 [Anableps anableps]
MSWFQSLRDDFTLRPFEIQDAPDSAAMASGSPDLVTNQEPAEVQEDCSGKKKSKFQTFKKLFTRKKRKEPQNAGAEEGLKGSQSSDNVSKSSENNVLTRSEKEKGSGSKISLGNKALSHDSVFVSDSSEANEGLGASQDSIHGKVKSLQLQLKQAIRLGSPPSLMCVKKTEDAGTTSEDDGLPCSPPDYTPLHSVKSKAERTSSNSLHGIDSDEQLSCAASSRAVSPPVVPGDFSQPASPFVCLDNSAAKHKLGLRNKACNKRKPARRLELKTEVDSATEEELNVFITAADVSEEQEHQKAEVEYGDQLKPKAESEEEEDEENKPQKDSSTIPLRDKEGEDEPEAEQDVSHAPDASCPPESSLSEEDASDDQRVPSPSSRSSSLDSPSVTPEPPAGLRQHLTGPPGFSCAVDNHSGSDSSSGEEDIVEESREEGSSFLDEVLSSLKTSHSSDVEISGVVLEMEETEEEDKVIEIDESKERKGEEAEEEAPTGCEAAALCSGMSDRAFHEENNVEEAEEEEVVLQSLQEEEVAVVEEAKSTEEEPEEEEEDDKVSEQFIQHSDEEAGWEEDAEEVELEEEDNMVSSQAGNQEETTEERDIDEEEEEEEAVEVKKGPEVVQEEWENRKEESCVEVDEVRGEEAEEEAKGDEEEMTELVHGTEDEEVPSASSIHEAGEGDDGATHDGTTPGVDDQILPRMSEGQEILNETSGAEEEVEEVELQDHKSEDEEAEQEAERSPSDGNQSGEDMEGEKHKTSPLIDVKLVEAEEEGGAFSRPPPLFLPDSRSVSHSDESPISSPSKTTTLHINLVSPTSEKPTSPFELRPAAVTESLPLAEDPPESNVTSATEERIEAVKDPEEEEKQSAREQNDSAPASAQEVLTPTTDQSKVRFTIAPAWQRLQSPPGSPSAVPALQEGGAEVAAAGQKDQDLKAEPGSPAKAELVLSPGRGRSSGSFTSKPQSSAPSSSAEPQTAAPARTSESTAVAEANPDSPFGVRLRKTSALLRLSSEEVDSEAQAESPTHPPSSKAESPQPISSKPSVNHPVSNKPALPKKPEVHGDAGLKLRRISEPAAARGAPGGSDPPSWISVAKQKQKVYKETPLNEIAVKKEEQEKKPALPTSVSSAPSREQSSNKAVEPPSKVSVEKETRRTLSVPTPVPPQPLKSPLQKPQAPPAPAKPALPPDSHHSSPLKSPASTTPSILSKTPPVTSPSFSPRTVPEKPASRAPGLSRQATSPQRGSPPTALPQNEPPWMALAKKKAKAWSEMPQIVQ